MTKTPKFRLYFSLAVATAIGALLGGSLVLTQPVLLARAHAAGDDTYQQLDLFGNVFDRIRADYVEEPEDKDLITAAIRGMLASLDPHSSYLSPDSFKAMQVESRGEFGGLGIEVTLEDNTVKVVTPIDDTPAYRAGIISNDLIIALDGKDIVGTTLDKAVRLMRGKVGTPITLTILRGKQQPFDVTIKRDIVRLRSVISRLDKGKVGYVRLTHFSERATNDMLEAIAGLEKEAGRSGLSGLVLDLRNNPGGLLEQAVSVSDAFLAGGEIVSTRGRNASDTQRFQARPDEVLPNLPMVVLINGGSASAAEIVAGSLQDHQRATILGTKSFGKGSVQKIIPLQRERGAIRLTISRYFTPSGRSIQAKGISPDLIVEQKLEGKEAEKYRIKGEAGLDKHLVNEGEAEDASGSVAYVPKDPADDTQLKRAINFIISGETITARFVK